MTPRPAAGARVVAVTATLLAIAMGIVAVGLDIVVAESGLTPALGPGWTSALPGIAMAVTGGFLQWRLSWHPIAVILLGFGFLRAAGGLAMAWVNVSVTVWPDAPLAYAALIPTQRLDELVLLVVPLLLVLFPDGRLPRRPVLRGLAIASLAVSTFSAVPSLFAPWDAIERSYGGADPSIRHWFAEPWGWGLLSDSTWDALLRAGEMAMYLGPVLAVIVLIGRGRGADLELRRQLRWIEWAGAILVLVMIAAPFILGWYGSQLAYFAATVLLCVAIAMAVTRYRLYNIDRVIGWTVLYGVMLLAVVLLDVALLAVVGSAIGENTVAIVAAVVVLLLFAPLREPLLSAIQRLVYGRRGDPYRVVAGLADSLEHADDPDDQLAHIAGTVARAFASSYVAVRVDDAGGGRLEAHHGTPGGETITLPLSYRGERIGELELAPPRRRALSRRDERLLADVVRQAAAAVRTTVLNTQLQRSREELVSTREEERRRIRRDVHDGLGPSLAAVKVRIDAAINVADRDPAEAKRILETASQGVTDAVGDIRRIVHDLRPPALDDLGFRAAIERSCEPLGGDGVEIELDYRLEGVLPPAAEVAAYRIVNEALTNVRRHANARHAHVTVAGDGDELVIEVVDDGGGIPGDAPPGIGLHSMRERALELGGALTLERGEAGGTAVRATLPLRRREAEAVRA